MFKKIYSFCVVDSDNSNDQYGAIGVDAHFSQDLRFMTDSGSDDDSNDDSQIGKQPLDNSKGYNYDSEDGVNSIQRNSYDMDEDFSKRASFKLDFDRDHQTDSSANDVECYSPSKELRRQSTEYRNSFEDYSPRPNKIIREESYSSSNWNYCLDPHFNHVIPDYSPTKTSKTSKDKYSLKKRHEKSERKSKSNSSRKRKYDEISATSSSGMHDFLSPEHEESLPNYSIPTGTSLNKPLQGGIGASIMVRNTFFFRKTHLYYNFMYF